MGGWRFLPRNGKALLCLGGAQEEGWGRVLVWMAMGREGGRAFTPVWTCGSVWPGALQVIPVSLLKAVPPLTGAPLLASYCPGVSYNC